jgi:hypothetical protein
MTIELIKEVGTTGYATYHVRVDGDYQSGSVRSELHEAKITYEAIKENYSKARTEILIREEI